MRELQLGDAAPGYWQADIGLDLERIKAPKVALHGLAEESSDPVLDVLYSRTVISEKSEIERYLTALPPTGFIHVVAVQAISC